MARDHRQPLEATIGATRRDGARLSHSLRQALCVAHVAQCAAMPSASTVSASAVSFGPGSRGISAMMIEIGAATRGQSMLNAIGRRVRIGRRANGRLSSIQA